MNILATLVFSRLKDQNKQVIIQAKEAIKKFFSAIEFHKLEKQICETFKTDSNPLLKVNLLNVVELYVI